LSRASDTVGLRAAALAEVLDEPEQGGRRELRGHCGKHSFFSSHFFSFPLFRSLI
jgi:hypothetical protein